MNISELTPAQKTELLNQLKQEEKETQAAIQEERVIYKETVKEQVGRTIDGLLDLSEILSKSKAEVFNAFSTLISLKKELFGYKDGQQSHTFTDDLGRSIEIGYRTIDGWDDTQEAGVAKVNQFIDSLATNEETAKLVKMIQNLLKKDTKGNLKANRVLELKQLAQEHDNPIFLEGVQILMESYKPVRSAFFVEARIKDKLGKSVSIPLSITSAPFPEGTEVSVNF
ncbi:DUF3164 family protein [Persicobacter sp. CCB-QB2]|uniref:DUF3164 family protein n=1 Tax=Persicobacter sp. CCB-QB2 TaxID=1561025 RepID=UPI0006A99FDA|nr:DUF3164 family protein [Persicobacter sp. CCB-QB2]